MKNHRAQAVLMTSVLVLLAPRLTIAQMPPNGNSQFFPSDVFGSGQSIIAREYSRYLRSMQEKPLAQYVSPEFPLVYRLLIVTRPWNAPVVVRLWIRSDGLSEIIIKAARDGGHPQILTVSKTVDPAPGDVGHFLKLLEHAGFWTMPALNPRSTVMGAADWMLEGLSHDLYHAVCRSSPELRALKDPLDFLVGSLAKLDLRSLPVGPKG